VTNNSCTNIYAVKGDTGPYSLGYNNKFEHVDNVVYNKRIHLCCNSGNLREAAVVLFKAISQYLPQRVEK